MTEPTRNIMYTLYYTIAVVLHKVQMYFRVHQFVVVGEGQVRPCPPLE